MFSYCLIFFSFPLRNVVCLVLVAPSFIYVFIFTFSFSLPSLSPCLFFHPLFFFKIENHDRAIFFGKLRELAPSCSKHTSLCPLHVGLKYNFCQSMLALFAATTHSASGWGDVVKLVDRNWRLQVLSKVLSSEAWVWSQQSFLL